MKWNHLTGAGLFLLGLLRTAAAVTLPGPLVTPQWLAEHQNEVVIMDVRDDPSTLTREPRFEVDQNSGHKNLVQTGGHIAGAIAVDFNQIRETRVIDGVSIMAQLPDAKDFTRVMDDAGLNRTDKPIIIVSTGQSVEAVDMATRQYFQMRYFGVPDGQLALLNGGLNAWLQAGYAVSTERPAVPRGDWVAGPGDRKILATLEDVKQILAQHSAQIIDARPTAQYLGIVKKPVVRTAGHLPGARSFPTDAVTRPVGAAHEFMSAAAYRQIYTDLGLKADTPTITYCNTGHLASGAWFVNHVILGNPNSRLYAGSMIEWTNLGNPTVGLPQ